MYKVVVGIDFGSSGTGYAYSYNNPEDIYLGKFPNQGIDSKVYTQIILDSKLEKVLAFGNECNKYVNTNGLLENELYFKKIKMNLYEGSIFIKPENSSNEYPLEDVIAKILEYIKKEAFNTIQNQKPKITLEEIKFIVTVPAIWDLSLKGIMIKASKKAGLFNQNTDILNFFALEPEAASIYCSSDKSIDTEYFMPGKSYIICDLGGGTGDIVTHSITLDGDIIEKYSPIGGNYGSDEIDKAIFKRVFYKLFGFGDYNSLKKRNAEKGYLWHEDELYKEWVNFEEEIQNIKKITEDSRDKFFFLNCQLFEEFTDLNLEIIVKNYNKSCQEGWRVAIKNTKKWVLYFPFNIIFDLIKEHSKIISKQIAQIQKKVNDVESILYVGGYCSNEILLNNIKEEFSELSHLKPSRPEIAVVKGAVLFGINPEKIKFRIFPYTLGFNCDDDWNDAIHGKIGEQQYNNVTKKNVCLNSFHIFIKIGEIISKNHTITHNFISIDSRYINLKFFKSLKSNPILWTEEGVELIGSDIIDLQNDYPINERNFTVTLKFGGTYVEAKCFHNQSKLEKDLPLYFNK